jgi:hypothetical protein
MTREEKGEEKRYQTKRRAEGRGGARRRRIGGMIFVSFL